MLASFKGLTYNESMRPDSPLIAIFVLWRGESVEAFF